MQLGMDVIKPLWLVRSRRFVNMRECIADDARVFFIFMVAGTRSCLVLSERVMIERREKEERMKIYKFKSTKIY